MPATIARLPALGFVLLAAFLVAMGLRSQDDTTLALVASSVLMFACAWASATHLLGAGAALRFVAIALGLGWFAEQMGATRGWFFGQYHYTDVLGWRLGEVPAVIPLLWFALCYCGYVLANLIASRVPATGWTGWSEALLLSLLAAMIVTAFDLGADPYLVFKLGAWVMVETDGAWFGETVQGFVGWTVVSFAIVLAFRWSLRAAPARPRAAVTPRHALLPLALYGAAMLFQAALGFPVETRSVAVFAMGIPLLSALAGWRHWQAALRAGEARA
jgi:putative membrane protein